MGSVRWKDKPILIGCSGTSYILQEHSYKYEHRQDASGCVHYFTAVRTATCSKFRDESFSKFRDESFSFSNINKGHRSNKQQWHCGLRDNLAPGKEEASN